MPAGGVNDNRAGRRVHSAASDRRRENNDGNQCFHGAALVDEMAFSLCGNGLATEEEARLALPKRCELVDVSGDQMVRLRGLPSEVRHLFL